MTRNLGESEVLQGGFEVSNKFCNFGDCLALMPGNIRFMPAHSYSIVWATQPPSSLVCVYMI